MQSDDEASIPDIQLSAVTRALLARNDSQQVVYDSGLAPALSGGPGIGCVDEDNDVEHTYSQTRTQSSSQIINSRHRHPNSTPSNGADGADTRGSGNRRSLSGIVTGSYSLYQAPKRFPKRSSDPADGGEATKNPRESEDTSTNPTTRNQSSRVSGSYRSYQQSERHDFIEQQDDSGYVSQKVPYKTSAQTRRSLGESSTRLSPQQEQQERPIESTKDPLETVPDQPPPIQRVVAVGQKSKPRRGFVVNGEFYAVLRKLGKGGSGRVYEVLSKSNQAWALKTIPLKGLDARGKAMIQNEVALLEGLQNTTRIVSLKDWSIDETKKCLYMVS